MIPWLVDNSDMMNPDHMRLEWWRYWNERDILQRCRDAIDMKGDYMTAAAKLMDDDLVILDDFGSTGVTDWRKEVLFALIDVRYESKKPTIITTNLKKSEISNLYGQRTADRIFAKENTVIDTHGMESMR